MVLLLALQVVLNSRVVTRYIDKFASEYIDGELNYSDIKVSVIGSFPRLRVTIDSLSLTYPHDKFAEFDCPAFRHALLDAGRGVAVDTLASFDRFTVAVNPWRLVGGRIRLCDAGISGLSAFLHVYGPDASNLDIFTFPEQPEDTVATKPLDLPWISIGEIALDGSPLLCYTAAQDTVFASLTFDRLSVSADAKLSSESVSVKDAAFSLDSLVLDGRLPADSVYVALDYLKLSEPSHHVFDLGLAASAMAVTSSFGKLELPLMLDGRVGIDMDTVRTAVNVPHLDASVAHVPVHLEGDASMYADSIALSARLNVAECPLDTLLRSYLDNFVELARDIDTDALLSLDVSAEGIYSEHSMPEVHASLRVPDASVGYRPLDMDGRFGMNVEADVTPDMYVSAKVNEISARVPGASVYADGSAADLLGEDPAFMLTASVSALLDSLKRLLPESLGIAKAEGNLKVDLSADTRLSELGDYKFRNSDIRGYLLGDRLAVSMPGDSLDADVFMPEISLTSNPDGLSVTADFDSVYFSMGTGLQARVREMRNRANITKVGPEGRKVPRMSVGSDNGMVFVKAGSSRIGVRNVALSAASQKRPALVSDGRRQFMDSLRRANPGASRRELATRMVGRDSTRKLPAFLSERDFAKKDIRISLDSSITRYLRNWEPSGSVRADAGYFASPALPLRTRLTSFGAGFTDNEVVIDSLSAVSGSSDISATGYVTGLRRTLMGAKGMLRTNLDIKSSRLNINEIVAALSAGDKDRGEVAPEDEEDESFVTDTLENAVIDPDEMSLIIVPANIIADVKIQADTVNYAEFLVDGVSTGIKVQERTAQLSDTRLNTNLGKIRLDAFYSTQTKSDISAGVDMHLSDISAQGIIQLLPAVDSLMPALKSFEGLLGCDISATTQLDTNMNVLLPTLDGVVRISGENLEVKDAGDLRRITRLLLFKNKNIGHIDNLYVDAVVHDSKIEVFPFELGVDRYKLALRGMQGLDNSMYYHVSILKSPFLLRFGINLFGTLDNWRFSLGLPKYRDGNVPAFTRELESVQLNILNSIRNVYSSSVENVMRYNSSNIASLESARGEKDRTSLTDNEILSSDAEEQFAAITVDNEIMEQEEDLIAEVDAVLEDTFIDAGKLLAEYEEATYEKGIKNRIERLKKQSEARKERKKAKSKS